jgi:hypothetical protein
MNIFVWEKVLAALIIASTSTLGFAADLCDENSGTPKAEVEQCKAKMKEYFRKEKEKQDKFVRDNERLEKGEYKGRTKAAEGQSR